jgi:sugar phosphate isomerase/epimerase
MSTSASVIDLYERGVGDNLGILWDTLHTYRHGESPEFTWSQIGDRVRHVHVKDSVSATAERFDFALLGEGTVPIPAIIGVLNRADYGGFVHFEWEKGWHPEIAGPEIAIPHFAKYMARLS